MCKTESSFFFYIFLMQTCISYLLKLEFLFYQLSNLETESKPDIQYREFY